jgi:hypothetical protein
MNLKEQQEQFNEVKPPLNIVLRTGAVHFCNKCGSTMSRIGFFMLFGKRYCDNKKCVNSSSNKIK